MSTTAPGSSKRCPCKCPDNLPLYEKLEQWEQERQASNSSGKFTYRKAMKSLTKCPIFISTGEMAQLLEGVGGYVAGRIDQFLRSYNNGTLYSMGPQLSSMDDTKLLSPTASPGSRPDTPFLPPSLSASPTLSSSSSLSSILPSSSYIRSGQSPPSRNGDTLYNNASGWDNDGDDVLNEDISHPPITSTITTTLTLASTSTTTSSSTSSTSSTSSSIASPTLSISLPSNTRTKMYVPKHGTAAYALLYALGLHYQRCNEVMTQLQNNNTSPGNNVTTPPLSDLALAPYVNYATRANYAMYKRELIKEAQRYTSVSFEPGKWTGSAADLYSGWSTMATLVKKGFVVGSGLPKLFWLTESGLQVATNVVKTMPPSSVFSSGILGDTSLTASLSSLPSDENPSNDHGDYPSYHNPSRNGGHKGNEEEDDDEDDVDDNAPLSSKYRTKTNTKKLGEGGGTKRKAREKAIHTDDESGSPNNLMNMDGRNRENDVVLGLDGGREQPPSKRRRHDSPQLLMPLSSPPTASPPHIVSSNSSTGPSTTSSSTRSSLPRLNLQDFDIVLLVDVRERYRGSALLRDSGSGERSILFSGMLSQQGLKCESYQLPVGDMMWVAQDKRTGERYVLDCIVERKRVADLIESIRDNRYKEQRMRMRQSKVKRLVYVIEGKIQGESEAMFYGMGSSMRDADREMIDSGAINTALATLETALGFNIVNTLSTADTVAYLARMHAEMVKWYSRPDVTMPLLGGEEEGEGEYLERFTERLLRQNALTYSILFGIQLKQIKLCSTDVVTAVLNKYPTLPSLLRAYEKLGVNTPEAKHLLANLITPAAKRITPLISERIHDFFCADAYPMDKTPRGSPSPPPP